MSRGRSRAIYGKGTKKQPGADRSSDTCKTQEVPVETAREKPQHQTVGQLTVKSQGATRSFEFETTRDEKGWLVGRIPKVPGCSTQARTESELIERLQEALELALEESAEPSTKH